jgi:tetratricopeptide (TPR) repeat protein
MSWVGWLIIVAALGVLVAVLRGAARFASELIDEHVTRPREHRRLREARAERSHRAEPAAAAEKHGRESGHVGGHATNGAESGHVGGHATKGAESGHVGGHATKTHVPIGSMAPAGKHSLPARVLKSFLAALGRKGYDYWVAAALSEADPKLKIQYLGKALKLNSEYFPAWGLQGNAMLEATRYEEALDCFERSLKMHPSALSWYKKGVCCHNLGRYQDAVACFNRAIQSCPVHDRQLAEDASRMKSSAENLLHDHPPAP